MTREEIQAKLNKIEAEGKDPSVSDARKFILRRWWKFWKRRLDQDPDLLAIKMLFGKK